MIPAEKYKVKWLYYVVAVFILFNTYLITKELYWAIVIPMALATLLLFLFAFDTVILLTAFVTPLSVLMSDFDMGVTISLPSEALLVGLLVFFVVKLFYERNLNLNFFRHPLSILILLHLIWMLVTTLTSELPFVSLKYLLSQLWFVIPMFFMGVIFFRNEPNIRRFLRAYLMTLMLVIIYSTIRHAQVGFDEEIGHWVMDPFYNDHTAYGAITALFIPVTAALALDRSQSRFWKGFAIVALIFLIMALYLSFSRAAWIGLIFAFGVFLLVIFKIPFRWIFFTAAGLVGFFFAFQQDIIDKLEKNKQDSSANFVEHVKSISNISSDASNLERINRWQSAIRLFRDRPVFGWGPGTYQFTYAPYQLSKEKTIISTNAGDRGNAHSEYISPLAERGLPGTLILLVMFGTVIYYGFKVFKKATSVFHRRLSIGLILGLITYFVHGIMNNFLDTDKLSVPFWAFFGIIVALDLYYSDTANYRPAKSSSAPEQTDQAL